MLLSTAAIDLPASYFVFGYRANTMLPEAYSNAPSDGAWMVVIRASDCATSSSVVYTAATVASMTTAIAAVAANDFVVIVLRGASPPSSVDLSSIGANNWSGFAAGQSYAIIGRKGAGAGTVPESRVNNGPGALLQLRVATTCLIRAASSGATFGNRGYIQVVPNDVRALPSVDNTFTIVGKDSFGNTVTADTLSPWEINFFPPLSDGSGSIKSITPTRGYFRVTWNTNKAGSYIVNVKLTSGSTGLIGGLRDVGPSVTSFPLTINTGIARAAQSTVSGALTTATSGASSIINLQPFDAFNNRITVVQSDVITGYIQNVATPATRVDFVPTFSSNQWVLTFTPTTAGAWNVFVIVNGESKTGLAQLNVVPGAASAAQSTISTAAISGTAGVESRFTITARDANSNPLTVQSATAFTLLFSAPASVLSSQVLYTGGASYQASVTPKLIGTWTATVQLSGVNVGSAVTFTVAPGAPVSYTHLTLPTNREV